MSIPISACMVIKAAKGDATAYNILIECMKINYACGHWSQFPCTCNPKCSQPSEQQMTDLNSVMQEYFIKNPVVYDVYTGPQGEKSIQPE